MKKIPQSKSEQAVVLLKETIAAGDWGEDLPGERVIAKDLFLSRGCVRKALTILEEDGVIAKPNGTRNRKILKRNSIITGKYRKVLFLSPSATGALDQKLLVQVASLRTYFLKHGMDLDVVSSRVTDFENVSDKSIKLLLRI